MPEENCKVNQIFPSLFASLFRLWQQCAGIIQNLFISLLTGSFEIQFPLPMNTNDRGQSELYLNAHDPCNAHPGPQWAESRVVTRYREHFTSVTGRLGPLLWSSSHWQYLDKSTKMLIASHSQLAELARACLYLSHIFPPISEFRSAEATYLLSSALMMFVGTCEITWCWPWWCWRWHRWYPWCCSDRHRWQMTYLESRCRHTSRVACHLLNIFIVPAWTNI